MKIHTFISKKMSSDSMVRLQEKLIAGQKAFYLCLETFFKCIPFWVYLCAMSYLLGSVHPMIKVAAAEALHFADSLPQLAIELPKEKKATTNYNIDKLAHAVAFAETAHCTDGTAIHRNNCFGIMEWDKYGIRHPRYFKTQADSFTEFKRIWKKSYGAMPTMALAARWTGNDHPVTWNCHVHAYYRGDPIPATDDGCARYLKSIDVL